jgi:cell division protein FtsB
MAGNKKVGRLRKNKAGGSRQSSSANRKLQPARKTRAGLWIVLMVFFFAEALFYAWCRVQCVNTGYGIDRETRRHQELMRDRNALKIEWARLKSPERIETIARMRLGLEMPGLKQTMILP